MILWHPKIGALFKLSIDDDFVEATGARIAKSRRTRINSCPDLDSLGIDVSPPDLTSTFLPSSHRSGWLLSFCFGQSDCIPQHLLKYVKI